MYDRTGLSTKCTLIKTGVISLRTGTEAKFRPFVDALNIGWLSLTSGVSAPPTMVMPKAELVLGISTWDTSPSNTGSRVIPEMKRE